MVLSSTEQILLRSDRGDSVAKISDALGVSVSHVYTVLRELRPDRPRKLRGRTSDVPRKVCGLFNRRMKPARIAAALGVTRAYVYKILADNGVVF